MDLVFESYISEDGHSKINLQKEEYFPIVLVPLLSIRLVAATDLYQYLITILVQFSFRKLVSLKIQQLLCSSFTNPILQQILQWISFVKERAQPFYLLVNSDYKVWDPPSFDHWRLILYYSCYIIWRQGIPSFYMNLLAKSCLPIKKKYPITDSFLCLAFNDIILLQRKCSKCWEIQTIKSWSVHSSLEIWSLYRPVYILSCFIVHL